MLKILGKLLNKDFDLNSDPIDTNVPENEIVEILLSQEGDSSASKISNIHIGKFISCISSHLGKKESQRLSRIAKELFDESQDPVESILDLATSDEGQNKNKWLFIQLDWRATNEIKWQIELILKSYDLTTKPEIDFENDFSHISDALLGLSSWLQTKGLNLIHIDTESDCYCSFVITDERLKSSIKLAETANLRVYCHNEFEEKCT
jgi:hypothetical protein